MRFHLLFSLLVVACFSGCGRGGDDRLTGTYTIDATASMELLKSSGNFDDEVLAVFEEMMNRSVQLEFSGDREITVLAGVRLSQKYRIIDKGADHVTIEIESAEEESQQQEAGPSYRIEFTDDDGFWRTTIGGESVKEKFVKQN